MISPESDREVSSEVGTRSRRLHKGFADPKRRLIDGLALGKSISFSRNHTSG